jgi:hypothetical protein
MFWSSFDLRLQSNFLNGIGPSPYWYLDVWPYLNTQLFKLVCIHSSSCRVRCRGSICLLSLWRRICPSLRERCRRACHISTQWMLCPSGGRSCVPIPGHLSSPESVYMEFSTFLIFCPPSRSNYWQNKLSSFMSRWMIPFACRKANPSSASLAYDYILSSCFMNLSCWNNLYQKYIIYFSFKVVGVVHILHFQYILIRCFIVFVDLVWFKLT